MLRGLINEEMQSYLADLYQQADERGMVLVKLRAAALLGRQSLLRGNAEDAIHIARSGIEIASQSNLSWLELQLRLLLDAALKSGRQHRSIQPRPDLISARTPGERPQPGAIQAGLSGLSEQSPGATRLPIPLRILFVNLSYRSHAYGTKQSRFRNFVATDASSLFLTAQKNS